MKKICLAIILLCTSVYNKAVIHSVSPQQALHLVNLVNEHVFIFISLDLPSVKKLYGYSYDEMLKHLRKQHTPESHKIIAFITHIMKVIDPLYPTLYHAASHAIGVTRRSLGWSHLIRSSCYEYDIVQPATRYIIPVRIDEHAKPLTEIKADTDEIDLTGYDCAECNTGILYVGTIDISQVIAEYIRQHPISCDAVIYIDTDYQQVCMLEENLKKSLPTIEILGLHVDSINTCISLENFKEIDSYMQSATEHIADQSSVANRHPELFNSYDIPIEYFNKNHRGQKR